MQAEPDVLSASSLLAGEPSLQSSDPGLVSAPVTCPDRFQYRQYASRHNHARLPRSPSIILRVRVSSHMLRLQAALMVVGRQRMGSLVGLAAQTPTRTSTSAPKRSLPACRAAALVGALLRNVAADGLRDAASGSGSGAGAGAGAGAAAPFVCPAPDESSTATAASRLVDVSRGIAYKAAASPASGGTGTGALDAKAAAEVASWGAVDSAWPGASGTGASSGAWLSSAAAVVAPAASVLSALAGGVVGGGLGLGGSSSSVGPGGSLPRPLAERSALLLLILVHNLRSGVEAEVARVVNPYRTALVNMRDADAERGRGSGSGSGSGHSAREKGKTLAADAAGAGTAAAAADAGPDDDALLPMVVDADASASAHASSGSSSSDSAVSVALPSPGVHFRSLLASLRSMCVSPLGTVLLYTLLHGCKAFSDAALCSADVDELVIPLAKQLYFAGALSPEYRYVLVIVVLLLSQDAAFAESAHKRMRVKSSAIPWFTERLLGDDISLGSLLTLLLVRLVAAPPAPAAAAAAAAPASLANDAFLHSNCLAVLANMSPYAEGLHPYAAQRLVALLGTLHKRHARAIARADAAGVLLEKAHAQVEAGTDAAASASAMSAAAALEAAQGDMARFDGGVRGVLEVIWACLEPARLPSNVALLYSLLHARSVVEAVAADATFRDEPAAQGVADAVSHFAAVIADAEAKARGEGEAGGGAISSGSAPAVPSGGAAASASASATTAAASSSGSSSATAVWEEEDVTAILDRAARVWVHGEGAAAAAASLRSSLYSYEEAAVPETFFVPHVHGLALAFTADVAWQAFEAEAAVPTRLVPLAAPACIFPAVPLPSHCPPVRPTTTASASPGTAASGPGAGATAPVASTGEGAV